MPSIICQNLAIIGLPGGCFIKISRALQNILRVEICVLQKSYFLWEYQAEICTCAQSHALGTRTKSQLEILIINVISGIVCFRQVILESSRNVCETTPWCLHQDGSNTYSFQVLTSSCLVKIKFSWQSFVFYFSYNQSTNIIKHFS